MSEGHDPLPPVSGKLISSMANTAGSYRIQVLERAFQILDVLAEEGSGATLLEIAAAVDLHKSTAHRLLMVLESARFIERNGTGKYRIGSRVMELGLSAASRLDVYEVAPPYLRALGESTCETAHLAVLRDCDTVSLIDVEGRNNLRMRSAVGARRPAHCTAHGKAILAFPPPERLDDFLRSAQFSLHTRRTITSAARFRTEMRAIRERGYAIDNEELEVGLRCLGAPVRDSSGAVIAGVSISGPVFRVSQQRTPSLARAVVDAANAISERLGYRPKFRQPLH
jgi:DNA-binding IclR family transcriptional regulator